uniref:hypothetical protein n=1 Tax=Synechococcus sp. UW106 TaxID=368495 RepID=UPI0010BDFFAF|nr:hypothetical protein [Synechococcus sp. UW106]
MSSELLREGVTLLDLLYFKYLLDVGACSFAKFVCLMSAMQEALLRYWLVIRSAFNIFWRSGLASLM